MDRVAKLHELEFQLARDLVAVSNVDGFRQLGFSGPAHYGEVRGVGPVARTLGLLRLGRDLDALPASQQAYLAGRMTTERAYALCEVALPADEQQWCERAVRQTTAQFQQEVRQELVERGERPPTRRRIIEIQDTDALAFEQARGQIHRDLGRVISEGEAIGELSRHYVECRDSKRRRIQTARTLAAQAGTELPEGLAGARYIPSPVARFVWERDKGRCQVPGCTFPAFIEMGHLVARRNGGQPTAENLLLICRAHNTLMEDGLLDIRGSGSCPTFLHQDGRPFGQVANGSPTHGPSP